MALRCPICKQTMVPVQAGPAEIDVCKLGCKGLWFDAFELQAMDLPTADLTAALQDALKAAPRMHPPKLLNCPRCVKPLKPIRYRDTPIWVDFCSGCAGYFLDAGELQAIHQARTGDVTGDPVLVEKKSNEPWELEPVVAPPRPYSLRPVDPAPAETTAEPASQQALAVQQAKGFNKVLKLLLRCYLPLVGGGVRPRLRHRPSGKD